ncbi:MAG: cation-transporting P-type ATPase [Nanoarchaeota archaeon]
MDLDSKKRGLTSSEAEKKLSRHGLNELEDKSVVSPLKILFRQIKANLMIYLLLFAMAVSFFVGKGVTAYTILGVIVLVVSIGFYQEYRAEKVVNSLKNMLMPISVAIRDGKEQEIESKYLVPGDIVILRSGEKIPADCFIIEKKDFFVNESILTGESSEIAKKASVSERKHLDENLVFMGTFVVNGRCTAKVLNTGMSTKFGHISKLISTAEKEMPLQNKINRITKLMIYFALVFALATGILMFFSSPSSEGLFIEVLILTIAIAISAFPEGLPVVLITALSSGAYRMAQKNAIVNRMSIIETLGETTVICSDKTGTLTKGEMTVKKIFFDSKLADVSGVGYEGKGDFTCMDKKLDPKNDEVLDLLVKSSVMCNDSRIERTGEDMLYKISGNPTEASFLIMAAKAGIHREDLSFYRVEEIPFNSERKLMSVLVKYESGNYVCSKGAPEILIDKCKFVHRSGGVFRLTEKEKQRIFDANKELASDAFRVLAVAYKKVDNFNKDHFEDDLIFLGLVGMEDPPREEVKQAIQVCLNSGIRVKMITGDNKETAVAIAKKIGIEGKVLEGRHLDKMSEEELSEVAESVAIFTRVKPEHKLKLVRALKMRGEIVTMTGDGINDAPALKEAHIGVAMGKNGTDVSRDVADLTLKDDNFATIVEAIKEGRTIFKNIRKFISYQLSCNFAELSILFFGVLLAPFFGWQIPLLLSLQILFMNLVTDDLPAITLAVTPASHHVMNEKPRKKKEILNKSLIFWFAIAGSIMAAVMLFVFFFTFNVLNQDFESARTTALISLIFLEIANAFNFMSFERRVTFRSFFVNKYLFYASLISIAATAVIIYTPLNGIFGTVAVGLVDWIIAIVSSVFVILLFNSLKYFNEKKKIFELEF